MVPDLPMYLVLRCLTAGVWIVFGLVFKVMHLLPRHETIVATIIGEKWAGPATVVIGVAETGMGLWILSGRWPIACALAQTIVLVCMNSLEISLAKEHLLAPMAMVCANIIFVSVGWIVAVHFSRQSRAA